MHIKRNRRDSFVGVVFFAVIMVAIGLTATTLVGRVDVPQSAVRLVVLGP